MTSEKPEKLVKPVKLVKPLMITVPDLSEQMNIARHTFYDFARRSEDPLPLRTLKGFKRSSAMLTEDWEEWWFRNSDLFRDTRHN